MIDFSLQIPGYFVVFGILLGCGLARASVVGTESRRERTAVKLISDQEKVLS
jgi:hypothetical protein